jgi:hypothetical protein
MGHQSVGEARGWLDRAFFFPDLFKVGVGAATSGGFFKQLGFGVAPSGLTQRVAGFVGSSRGWWEFSEAFFRGMVGLNAGGRGVEQLEQPEGDTQPRTKRSRGYYQRGFRVGGKVFFLPALSAQELVGESRQG